MAQKFRNRLMKHVYESAKDLYEIGAITAEQLCEFEAGCTVPETSGGACGVSAPVPAYAAGGAKAGTSHAG
ncbi:MAG: hypothetical protein LBR23_06500 [Spirochaetaceae bacterium]|jgi:hypothetical protein|nr:hypothetical protein [Spirochaetaceae bacterium]